MYCSQDLLFKPPWIRESWAFYSRESKFVFHKCYGRNYFTSSDFHRRVNLLLTYCVLQSISCTQKNNRKIHLIYFRRWTLARIFWKYYSNILLDENLLSYFWNVHIYRIIFFVHLFLFCDIDIWRRIWVENNFGKQTYSSPCRKFSSAINCLPRKYWNIEINWTAATVTICWIKFQMIHKKLNV